jgi:hypothetical protein
MRATGNRAHRLEWLALGLQAILKYAKVRVAHDTGVVAWQIGKAT